MKKDVLKIVLLVIVILIPFVLAISESNKKPLLKRVEHENYSKQPKDSLWEFVKDEFEEGKIDLNVNYAEKFKEPILINVTNATPKDSIAIEGLIKELRRIFPLKEVAYFSDYVGKDFTSYTKERKPTSALVNKSFDEIQSYTTHISFEKLQYTQHRSVAFNIKDLSQDYGQLRNKNSWNILYNITNLVFDFEGDVSVAKRQVYINEGFFKLFWKSYYKNIETKTAIDPFIRRVLTMDVEYSKHSSPIIHNDFRGVIEDHQFLIEKMFSKDFKTQFEDYMYQTYPWRYANIFLDKEKSKQDAIAVVVFMGFLILILSCSLFWNRKFKLSFWNYFLPIVIYMTSLASLKKIYAYLVGIDNVNNAVLGIVLSFVFTSLIALVSSFVFWQIEKRILPNKSGFGFQLFFKLLLTFAFLYFPNIIITYNESGNIIHSNSYNRALNDFQFLFITIGLTVARGILIYLNHFSDSLVKEKDVELSKLKEANAQSELKLLQSHINPHFLYNALNSIAGLAHSNPDKTEKMALSLSNLFRYSINKKGQKMSTVKEEVLMVENYLEIEKIRFGDRLKFTLQVDETLENEEIPMFLIQPLVENAIKHGVSEVRGEGMITLEIKKESANLLIIVSDNGPNFPNGLVSGHGLQTVYDLLRLSYGDKASLKWENTPEKKISILITKS